MGCLALLCLLAWLAVDINQITLKKRRVAYCIFASIPSFLYPIIHPSNSGRGIAIN